MSENFPILNTSIGRNGLTMQRIPLTIIGGYLGTGKTTLLNHILRHNEGRQLVVIVNDFGSINIDAELIESQDEEVINLANGCICCTLVDGFITTLINLLNLASPPDHIVVEASGVADPYKLGQYGHLPGLHLDGVIVVADAETVRRKARDRYVGKTVARQLQGADVIVLNKVDLVTDETRKAARAWLGELVPDAHIIESRHGNVPLPLLLGDVSRTGSPSSNLRLSPGSSDGHHHYLAYDTWSYAADEHLDGDAFRALVERLPEGIIRAKGVLYLKEDPDHRVVFQLVGKRWSLKPGGGWGNAPPRSQLVMIGLPGSIDGSWLEETIKD